MSDRNPMDAYMSDEDRIKLTGVFNPPVEDDEKGEEIPNPPVEDSSLWETRIIVTAKSDIKISQTQTMQETKTYDVVDFLTQTQLDHILDCIHPINEI